MKKVANNFGKQTLESMNQAQWYNQWTLNLFKDYLEGKILEVGCGIGNFTKTLTSSGKIWAIDIDKEFVKQTKEFCIKANVGLGDVEKGKYFFKDKQFDTIVCINVLEHIQNDIESLDNIYKLLKSNGRLILLVPIHNFLYGEIDKSIGHYRRYNPDKLTGKMLELGYTIISAKKLNFLGALGWFISGKILKNKQITENKIKIFNSIAPFFLKLEDLCEPAIGTSVLIIAQKK